MNWLLMGLAVLFAAVLGVVAVAVGITGGWVLFVLAAILAIPLFVDMMLSGARPSAAEDGGEPAVPAAHVESGDGRPLGDSPELHGDLDPIDLPRENPARRELEAEARRGGGGR
jgi:hypothetical protein